MYGDTFSLKNYEGLKKPKAWSEEKSKDSGWSSSSLLSSSGMLKYQATPIHTPLTLAAAGGSKPGVIASVHAKMFRKKFTAMFQVVQHMMGQGDKDAIARVNLPRTRPLPALPLFVQRGKKSTLLYDPPLCRGHA